MIHNLLFRLESEYNTTSAKMALAKKNMPPMKQTIEYLELKQRKQKLASMIQTYLVIEKELREIARMNSMY